MENILSRLQPHRKKIIYGLIALVAVGFLLNRFVFKKRAADVVLPTKVSVVKAEQRQEFQSGVNTTVSLKANADVVLKARVDSNLNRLYVAKRQRVKAGALLAELEHSQQSANVASAEAQIEVSRAAAAAALANREHAAVEDDRYEELVSKGYVTHQEADVKRTAHITAISDYDKAVESIAAAEAQLASTQATLDDYIITAPFDGVVLDDYDLKSGNLVVKDRNIVRLADIETMKATVSLQETVLTKIAPGLKAKIICEALPNETFTGVVTVINPFIDAATHTFNADIAIDNAATGYKLTPGMFARVFLVLATEKNAVVVPNQAIRSDNTVLVVDSDKKVRLTPIKRGMANEHETAVLSGLNDGDLVVITGGNRLKDGDEVTYK